MGWADRVLQQYRGMVLRHQRHLTEDKSLRKDRIVTGIVVEYGAYL